jgi:AbrB family looped-hinge helix DNA binding protein
MSTATLTSKGQITIPKEVREFLRVGQGDRLEFRLEEDGTVRLLRPGRSILELAGILHRPGMKPMSVREMDESMMSFLGEEDERIRGYAKR